MSIWVSVVSGISKVFISISTIKKIRISISLRLSISRSLSVVGNSVGIGISVVSSIAKTVSVVSTIQKVGVSISLGLGISLTLSVVGKSMVGIWVSVVAGIAKMSISSVQKVRVGISLGLGLRLSKGNSGQKGNGKCFHHLDVSPTSDQQRMLSRPNVSVFIRAVGLPLESISGDDQAQ